MGRFSVLVFGPESVSYERSRGIRRWVLREISARVFFGNIQTYQYSLIYPILKFFRTQFLKNVLVPRAGPGPGPGPMGPAHGPGPYWAMARPNMGLAGPIKEPGQAPIWAWNI